MDHHEVKWWQANGCGCFLMLLMAVMAMTVFTVILVKGNS